MIAPDQRDVWRGYAERYREKTWRSPLYRDIIIDDLATLPPGRTMLDIGCGRGFDDLRLQAQISEASGTYMGIEPDSEIQVGRYFRQVHRSVPEDAPVAPGSVDLAFAVMVLEHLRKPERFWGKLHETLRAGGIFWGSRWSPGAGSSLPLDSWAGSESRTCTTTESWAASGASGTRANQSFTARLPRTTSRGWPRRSPNVRRSTSPGLGSSTTPCRPRCGPSERSSTGARRGEVDLGCCWSSGPSSEWRWTAVGPRAGFARSAADARSRRR